MTKLLKYAIILAYYIIQYIKDEQTRNEARIRYEAERQQKELENAQKVKSDIAVMHDNPVVHSSLRDELIALGTKQANEHK